MRLFTALQTFDSPQTESTYLEGYSYTIRGNRYLNALAEVWEIENKIQFEHDPMKHRVTARGEDPITIIERLQEQQSQYKQSLEAKEVELLSVCASFKEVKEHFEQLTAQLQIQLTEAHSLHDKAIQEITATLEAERNKKKTVWELLKEAWVTLWA